ncbi:MAG: hypothetical protein ACRD18_17935 [Terriglobia bacterium]
MRRELELGVRVYQVAVYLNAVKGKLGGTASVAVKTLVTSLSTFDAAVEAALRLFLEAARAADERHTGGCLTEAFPGPSQELTRYYANLAAAFLIAAGCPLQPGLTASMGAWLFAARWRADEVFEPEVRAFGGLSEGFQWSTEPGPFERQLQRQQNNPLFPATARTISKDQIHEARLGDLKRMADFMGAYRPIVREVLSLKTKTKTKMIVEEASDLEKSMIDLVPSCMVLGDYFSRELNFLESVSDSIDQELAQTTKESGLRDVYKRVMALAHVQGNLLAISVALPIGDGTEDFPLRSILSEELELISSNEQLCGATGALGDAPVDSANWIISDAIREGLDPDLGRRRLDAFRSGFGEGRRLIGKGEPRAGFWAGLKRVVGRARQN